MADTKLMGGGGSGDHAADSEDRIGMFDTSRKPARCKVCGFEATVDEEVVGE